MKKVSIIIPVYNVSKYLTECIHSVICQTYENLEIIFIDDGSTDGSSSILDHFARKDKRIKVIHQNNAGAAIAKNHGLDIATGQYITFMDSDDNVEKDWISTMVSLLEDNNADLSECAFDKYYVNGFESETSVRNIEGVLDAESYMEQYLDLWTNSLFWTKLFKRELTENIRFRNERRCIDDEFYTYKIVSKAKKVIRTNKILYHYRQRISSAVHSKNNRLQITEDAIIFRIERYNWIKKYFPRLKKKYLDRDIDFLLYFSNNSVFDLKTKKIYKKTAWFYFIECLKIGLNAKLIYKAHLLILSKPNENIESFIEHKVNTDNYFR